MVQFVKVKRPCPHNSELEEKGEKRGYIYDYHIYDNGKFVAMYKPRSWRRGVYELCDFTGAQVPHILIKNQDAVLYDGQKEFKNFYEEHKLLIPSFEEVQSRTMYEREEKYLQGLLEARYAMERRCASKANELLAAVKELMENTVEFDTEADSKTYSKIEKLVKYIEEGEDQ